MTARWLHRDFITGPYLALALSEKDFRAAMKHCKVPPHDTPKWITEGANATTHMLTNPEGAAVCVVCLGDCADKEGPQIAAMLVHEAVHVWQHWCATVGETTPSSEFEAYSIQAISQRLMTAYADTLK